MKVSDRGCIIRSPQLSKKYAIPGSRGLWNNLTMVGSNYHLKSPRNVLMQAEASPLSHLPNQSWSKVKSRKARRALTVKILQHQSKVRRKLLQRKSLPGWPRIAKDLRRNRFKFSPQVIQVPATKAVNPLIKSVKCFKEVVMQDDRAHKCYKILQGDVKEQKWSESLRLGGDRRQRCK